MRRHFEPPVWLLIVGLIYCATRESVAASFENKTTHGGNNRPRVFSPRMDYDEWTPLGRGNPLRNDPTYDYVPPVLDRVQYWLDSHTTESPSKRDILLLGATAKKTSVKLPEQYLKFANRPKFPNNNQETQTTYKKNFTNNPGPDPAKLRTTSNNFRNDVADYRNQNRMPSVNSGSYFSNSYYGQPKPYTMMLPPPLVPNSVGDHHPHLSYDHQVVYEDSYQFSTQTESGPLLHHSDQQLYDYNPSKTYSQPHQQPSRLSHSTSKPTQKGTLVSHIETLKSYSPSGNSQNHRHIESTTSSVSFEKSDLVYQSSQTLSGGWLVNDRRQPASTIQSGGSNNRDHYYQEIDHQAAGSSNHEVVIGQNANIIVQGESCANDEVVIGHKEAAPSVPNSNGVRLTVEGNVEKEDEAKLENGELGSTSNMHIVIANTPTAVTTDAAVALVMPTNYVEKKEEKLEEISLKDTSEEKRTALEADKPGQEVNSFENTTDPPGLPIYLEEHQPSPMPMRNPMPYHQPISQQPRFPPSRIFGDLPVQQQMFHQSRPVQPMMAHYNPNLHLAMETGLRPPAPPSVVIAHGSLPETYQKQQQPNSMMNMPEINQPRRPYQHLQGMQSFGTTMTSAGPLAQMMTSVASPMPSVNPVHQGQSQGQGQGQTSYRVSEPVQTTFQPNPIPPRINAEGVSGSTFEGDTKEREKVQQSQLAILLKDEDLTKRNPQNFESLSTTSTPLPVTTVSSLTTDQIFSHYKQPVKPIRGPMYLIIQGHSKVKTYKPTVENHGNAMEENEIADSTTARPISKFEKFVNENTKRIATEKAAEKAEKEKEVAKKAEEKKQSEDESNSQDSLLSLLESGFSAFAMPPLDDLEVEDSVNSTSTT